MITIHDYIFSMVTSIQLQVKKVEVVNCRENYVTHSSFRNKRKFVDTIEVKHDPCLDETNPTAEYHSNHLSTRYGK